MYRLFVARSGASTELASDLWRNALRYCHSSKCVEIIMRNQRQSDESDQRKNRLACLLKMLAKNKRFDVAPELLIRWSGEPRSIQELAKLKDPRDFPILHVVATAIIMRMPRGEQTALPPTPVRRWDLFLHHVIDRGANCLSIWRGGTPLLAALICYMIDLDHGSRGIDFAVIYHFLRCWRAILEKTGVDLEAYWAEERKIWCKEALQKQIRKLIKKKEARPHHIDLPLFIPIRLLRRTKTSPWDLEACEVMKMSIFRRQLPPGSWDKPSNPLATIIWPPNSSEVQEGHWVKLRSISFKSDSFKVRVQVGTEPATELLRNSQDDHGLIALRASHRQRRTNVRRRSASQPPPLRRRAKAYFTNNEPGVRSWLWCHLCPQDNRWRFTCRPQLQRSFGFMDLRKCLRQDLRKLDIQNGATWKEYSFLSGRH